MNTHILAMAEGFDGIGKVLGAFIFSIITLLSLVKCYRIASRKTTSAPCVYALFLPLITFLLFFFYSIITALSENQVTTILSAMFLCLASFPCSMAGIVLAIVGLATFQKNRHYQQGRKQAAWAIVLGSLQLLLLLIGCGKGLAESFDTDQRLLAAGSAFEIHDGKPFGYSIDLTQTDWHTWPAVHETDNFADCGGLHPNGCRFTLTAVVLSEPLPAFKFIQQGLYDLYGIEKTPVASTYALPERPEIQAQFYAYESNGNRMRDQLMITTNAAYLLSVWTEKASDEELADAVEQIFEAVQLNPQIPQLSLDEQPAERQAAQGTILNQIALVYYNAGRFMEALDLFERGSNFAPENPTYFGNILAACEQLNKSKKGLDLLKSAPFAIRQSQSVRAWEAELLEDAGKLDEADKVYRLLFKEGHRSDEDLIEWINVRSALKNIDGMEQLIADYAIDPSMIHPHQLDIYTAQEDYKKVVDLGRQIMKTEGVSEGIALRVIDAYQALDNYRDALSVSEELLTKGVASVDAYHEKAASQYNLKWYRESKETLEAALKLNPENETTLEWLQYVSATLGEGSNSSLKNAIEPVVLPEALAARGTPLPPSDFGKDFGARYDKILQLWDYNPGVSLRQTTVQHITVLDAAGVSAFSSLEYSFDPVYENIFVNRLVVKDTNGTVVATGEVNDYYVIDDESDGLITDDQQLVVPVPNLQPGYRIEATLTRETERASNFTFTRTFLSAKYPSFYSAAFCSGETNDIKVVTRNDIIEVPSTEGFFWEATKPVSYRREPHQVSVERILPLFLICTSTNDWEQCATEYYAEVKEQLTSPDSITKLAEDLTTGLETEEEKAAALIRYVRTSYTYKPLEFGRSGHIPDRPEDTLKYRYGDCKDLSVLLRALLNAVKIEANLVLCNSSYRVYKDLPTSDQFNHVIVYLPSIRGGLFVDSTDQMAPAFCPVPVGLSRSRMLIINPEDPVLKTSPAYPTAPSTCSIQRKVTPELNTGTLAIQDQLEVTDYYASFMRDTFRDLQKIKYTEWLHNNVCSYVPGLEVRSMEIRNLEALEEPLLIDITYQYSRPPSASGDPLQFTVPAIWSRYYFSFQKVLDRQNPFGFSLPFNLNLTLSIAPPPGYAAENRDASKSAQEETPYIEWSATAQAPQFNATLQSGTFEATEYADFIRTTDLAVDASTYSFGLKKMVKE